MQLRPLQPFRLFPTVESPTDALFPLLALPPREVHHVQDYCARPGPRRGRRPGTRHARRPLPHRGARGRRRDGRGLPRARRRARARGGDQGPPPIARRRPGVRRPVPPRGARRGVPLPPEHRRRLRLGRGRRHLLHGHGVRPRARRARAAERERPARAGAGRRDRAADAPRARGRARAGHRPPRHQAREHPRHERRHREGRRLRPGPRVRRRQGDAGGRRPGHGAVPVPRADPRRAGRPALGPVLARHRDVRAADRPAAVHRRDGDEHRVQASVGARAEAVLRGRQRAEGARRLRPVGHRPRPRAPSGERHGDATRPRVDRVGSAACPLARRAGGRPSRGERRRRRDRTGAARGLDHADDPSSRTDEASPVPAVHGDPVAGRRARRHGVGRVDVPDPPPRGRPAADRHAGRRCEGEPDRPRVQGEDRRRGLPTEHPGGQRGERRSRGRDVAREGRDRHARAVAGSEAGARPRPASARRSPKPRPCCSARTSRWRSRRSSSSAISPTA